MATTYKSTTVQPAIEGPEVIYEAGQFVAYAHGKRLQGFDGSQDAWAAARAAVFNPRPERPSTIIANTVIVTTEPVDDEGEPWTMITYAAGETSLSITQQADGSLDDRGSLDINTDDCTRQAARDLYAVVSCRGAQAWMGIDVPVVTITNHYDPTDAEPESTDFVTYACDGITVYDDKQNIFCLESLIDVDHYAVTLAPGHTMSDCTDLHGLERIHAALGAIIGHIKERTV